ncbi:P-loop containing nucleoside triphosphate hydrolase protein [Phlebopus sp. FC_14]|nr:P-loop containing nucleoside triphosphate hydrolase protein [Phlebopus sp. FC_14]
MYSLRRSLFSVRASRLSLTASRSSARGFRATALDRAPATAHALKPLPSEQPPKQSRARHFTSTKFEDAPISANSKKAIVHEYLTDVQEATLQPGLDGVDLLVQAKTGTGKTTAFLLPAIERIAAEKQSGRPSRGISVLVLSPTRELALQIHKEAQTLVKHHRLHVQSVIGGVNVQREQRELREKRCDILIATPGRLLDHLQNSGLQGHFAGLKCLVLDEADRLLDQGFQNALEDIFKLLPDRQQVPRQCMLYSATLSKDIKQIASLYLNKDHQFISTLSEDDVNIHKHVPQTSIIVPVQETLAATLSVLLSDVEEHGRASKVMVFCSTTRGTNATADILRQVGRNRLPEVLQIQSRMTQAQRTKVSDRFRQAKSAILVTSDVTARGMDFPDVSLVVQIGLPANSEQYIHRLGRTARAGKSGKGVIVLTPRESKFLSQPEMRTLPIRPHPSLGALQPLDVDLDSQLQGQAYGAWLGFNSGFTKLLGTSPDALVREANDYVRGVLGWREERPPPLTRKVVGALGLLNARGLNVVSSLPRSPRPSYGRESYRNTSEY